MAYIDTKYLFQCETCRHHRSGKCDTWCYHGEAYIPLMTKIPTADVEEVVRCSECLHYDFQHHQCDNPLGLWSTYMDKFCCYGERKDA